MKCVKNLTMFALRSKKRSGLKFSITAQYVVTLNINSFDFLNQKEFHTSSISKSRCLQMIILQLTAKKEAEKTMRNNAHTQY